MAKRTPDPFRLVSPVKFQVKKAAGSDLYSTLAGRFAVFGNIDEGGDVCMPGCFGKSIRERVPAGMVKFCANHDHSDEGLIGTVTEAKESDALETVGSLASTQRAQDIARLIDEGHLTHGSIGYDSIREDYVEMSGRMVRRLHEVKLYECSPVPFPMNESAGGLAVKSAAGTFAVPWQDLPLAPQDAPWDAAKAMDRVRAWATGGGVLNSARFRRAFLEWGPPAKGKDEPLFRGLIGDILDGALVVVPSALKHAEDTLLADCEDEDEEAVLRSHLARYRRKGLAGKGTDGTLSDDSTAGPPTKAPTGDAERERRLRALDLGLRLR